MQTKIIMYLITVLANGHIEHKPVLDNTGKPVTYPSMQSCIEAANARHGQDHDSIVVCDNELIVE